MEYVCYQRISREDGTAHFKHIPGRTDKLVKPDSRPGKIRVELTFTKSGGSLTDDTVYTCIVSFLGENQQDVADIHVTVKGKAHKGICATMDHELNILVCWMVDM